MNEQDQIEALTEQVLKVVQTNCDLIKLQAIERSSVAGSFVLSQVIVGGVGVLFLFFFSLCVGFYFSERLGSFYLGFATVAVFYLFIGLILLIGRKFFLEIPIRDKIIQKLYK